MPRLTNWGDMRVDRGDDGFGSDSNIAYHHSFDCIGSDGKPYGEVYLRVKAGKFLKHVDSPLKGTIRAEGTRHTAIAPQSWSHVGPLYEQFARDFVSEFVGLGSAETTTRKPIKPDRPFNLELTYDRKELRYATPGINVGAGGTNLPGYRHLVVAANVGEVGANRVRQNPRRDQQTGKITVVYIKHGPLLE